MNVIEKHAPAIESAFAEPATNEQRLALARADTIAHVLGVELTDEQRIAVANKPAAFVEAWLRRQRSTTPGDRYKAAKMRKKLTPFLREEKRR